MRSKKQEKTGKILIIALIIMFLAVIYMAVLTSNTINKRASDGNLTLDTRSVKDKEEIENPLASRFVTFAGIEDCVLNEGGKVELENLEENGDFLLKYTVTDEDTGKEVFTTDLIPSGERIYWVPSETLEKGIYHLAFLQSPYYLDETGNYTPLTCGNNRVTLEIL